MIRVCVRACLLALPACLALVFAPALVAHASDAYETVILDRNTGLADAYRVRARVLETPAGSRIGGGGYMRVQVINPSDSPHRVEIRLASDHSGRSSYVRSLEVPAGATVSADLPLPSSWHGMVISYSLDGRLAWGARPFSRIKRHRKGVLSLLAITPGGVEAGQWGAYVESQVKRVARGAEVLLVSRSAIELPTSSKLLSGFDLIVAAAGTTLTPAQETVLARYVAGGGNLIVGASAAASDGPLDRLGAGVQTVREEGYASDGHHGLGRWFRVGRNQRPKAPALGAWLYDGAAERRAVVSRVTRVHAGEMPDTFWLPMRIPGIDAAPTGVFFLLIFLFAVVVGPVSYLYFRKRRRLPMLLVSIPLLGFASTAAILGYGILSEGFGVVGVMRSFTVLDQGAHLASGFSASTLYAGVQPASLRPRADSVVDCASFAGFSGRAGTLRTGATLNVDLDAGFRMRGSILPSRTPTPFVATTVGRARQRLRFRRREDGAFEVLAAPGFVPVTGAGAVLLRTKEGAFYCLGESGFLDPLSSGAGPAAAQRDVIDPVTHMQLGSGEYLELAYRSYATRYVTAEESARIALGLFSLPLWIRARLPELPPGSYLARMQQPPLREDFGLDIEYREEAHVVFGILGPEDILDD